MKKTLSLEEAWQAFYRGNDNGPADADFLRVKEAVDFLSVGPFYVTTNYITDVDHSVHINPGFLVAKVPFPGGHTDDVYEEQGFCCRLWFTNRGSGGGSKETSNVVKVLCPRQFVRVNAGVPCDYCGDIHLAN